MTDLLRTGVLGNSLRTLRHSMLSKLSGKEKPHGSLNLTGSNGGPLVVVSKTARFCSNTLEQIVNERIHNAHGFGGHAGVGVDLLQDLVDVDGVRLLPLLALPTLGSPLGFNSIYRSRSSFDILTGFRRHRGLTQKSL